ncbi:MAG: GH25 family lysozyme [Candidatus Paceibacterota bacterium]|jgi:lysozyme
MKNYFFFFLLFSILCFSCKNNESKDDKNPKRKKVVGIDVSHNQGKIDWAKLANQKNYKVKFAIIRSTMGDDRQDKNFTYNFREAKRFGLLVGTYHYYDPNENSKKQAKNYLRNSKQGENDILPVLDIEKLSRIQPKKRLLKGISNWLQIVEEETGYKPIIYTGLSFYKDYLAKDFADYPYWIASYSDHRNGDDVVLSANIHQFSESKWIKGLHKKTKIDVNVVDTGRLYLVLRK